MCVDRLPIFNVFITLLTFVFVLNFLQTFIIIENIGMDRYKTMVKGDNKSTYTKMELEFIKIFDELIKNRDDHEDMVRRNEESFFEPETAGTRDNSANLSSIEVDLKILATIEHSPVTEYLTTTESTRVQLQESQSTSANRLKNSSSQLTWNDFHNENQTVLIGLGSGKSGLQKLANLLSDQKDSNITHEFQKCRKLLWTRTPDQKFANRRYLMYVSRQNASKLTGDFALWNLPWVDKFLLHPTVKVVVLKRNREDTISSFVKWYKKWRVFPWITNEQIENNNKAVDLQNLNDAQSKWPMYENFANNIVYESCYPKYEGLKPPYDLETVAGKYYDDYYSTVALLMERYPMRVKFFDPDVLMNSRSMLEGFFNWLGLEKPYHFSGLKQLPKIHYRKNTILLKNPNNTKLERLNVF